MAEQHSDIFLYCNLNDLSDLYSRSDFAIVSGGQSKFEASLLGAYPLMIANSLIEQNSAQIYEDIGLGSYLLSAEEFSTELFNRSLEKALEDSESICTKRINGFKRVDGIGVQRVYALLNNLENDDGKVHNV